MLKPVLSPGIVQVPPSRLVLPGGFTQTPCRPVLAGGWAQVESGAAPFVGPLDAYTTNLAVCWSAARRLLSSYTGDLIRVRRSSDNTEDDFGYDADGNLDSAALLTFCGAGDGWIRTFYDQSGGARHMTQATDAEQIRIVAAGVLDTVGTEARPTGYCATSGTGGYSQASTFSAYTGTTLSISAVHMVVNVQSASGIVGVAKDGGGVSIAGANGLARSSTTEQVRAWRPTGSTVLVNFTYGTPFSSYLRQTGTDVVVKLAATSASQAHVEAFDMNRVVMGGVSEANQNMGQGYKHAEGAVWTADLGATAMDAIQDEQEVYFGL